MIVVVASVRARPDTAEALLELSRTHVVRSRTEDGCLRHEVARDPEDPCRLVFVEYWRDRDALARHFAVPASIDFVRHARELAERAPTIEIFEAAPAKV